jgi:sodium-dependent phosphate transporter
MSTPSPYDYQWFVIVGALLSFFMSLTIGANDVANSFATSIGAKTITLFQACCIAACMEFIGAITLGGEVSKSIASSIARTSEFNNNPEIFAYGMLCSLLSSSLWVSAATYKGYAVSTTHSIIGSVIGFTLVWKGPDAILWSQPVDEFPYVKGVVPIVVSWFTSPIMSAFLSIVIYVSNRQLILRRQNSDKIVFYALPGLIFITIFINLFFVLYKGAKAELNWSADQAAWVSAATAGGTSVLSGVVGIRLIKWLIKRRQLHQPHTDTESREINVEALVNLANMARAPYVDLPVATTSVELFDTKTEEIYKYLQVFSACSVAFAHGANDVANAVGPYAAIWHIYNNMSMSDTMETPIWILVIGGSGIVVGLWTDRKSVV